MYINVLTQIGAKAVDQNYIYSVPKELISKMNKNKIIGIKYSNKSDGNTDIPQKFNPGHRISLFPGEKKREAEYQSPADHLDQKL